MPSRELAEVRAGTKVNLSESQHVKAAAWQKKKTNKKEEKKLLPAKRNVQNREKKIKE